MSFAPIDAVAATDVKSELGNEGMASSSPPPMTTEFRHAFAGNYDFDDNRFARVSKFVYQC